MSGLTPSSLWMPPSVMRKPVVTSSKISTAPMSVAMPRTASTEPSAGVDCRLHGRVDVGIGVSQHTGTDGHHRHVDVRVAVDVRHLDAAGLRVVRGPLLGQEHFRPLREKLRPARDQRLRATIKSLALFCFHFYVLTSLHGLSVIPLRNPFRSPHSSIRNLITGSSSFVSPV